MGDLSDTLNTMASTGQTWVPKPADKVVRHPRMEQMAPVLIELPERRSKPSALTPPLILVYAFAILTGTGTLLLVLPWSHNGDGFAPVVDALFTATSAATVTGLVTVETSTYWSRPGQLVIMMLMFMGGIGVMTIATALLVISGQRLSLSQRLVVRETIGTAVFTNISNITLRIVIWAAAIQVLGFIVLFIKFSFIYSAGEAAWHAVFQAVSGFNNAGFTSIPGSENLSIFGTDRVVLGIIAVLVLLGSVSYWVVADIASRRRFSRLALNTKLVLVSVLVLLISGSVLFYVFESSNEGTLQGATTLDRAVTSFFQSVNRTAGFSTVDFDQTSDDTNVFYAGLMFVGGTSASVAGGIKVATLALIVIAIAALIRGRRDATAFGRRIPLIQIQWAFALATLSFVGVMALAMTLAYTDPGYPFLDLLFESVSAFATVGLSTGLTSELSTPGQILLVLGMFLGRVLPPMVIVVALSVRGKGDLYRYASEGVPVG
jgi:trk system potassium uptake protein